MFKISNENGVTDFNTSLLHKLAYLLSFLISLRNDVFNILGNCSGNEPLGEVSSLFPADLILRNV